MNILAVIHGKEAREGLFAEVIGTRGHALDEWSLAWNQPPPRPIDEYGAVLVFGGAMHADQDERHPWLREENMLIQGLLNLGIPLLGVCLGAQLLARAAHAPVGPASEPEIGWFPVELTPAAQEDAVLGGLPRRFEAFEWHYYTYGVPGGAVELARSPICTQAFRLGRSAWGIQFHAEVTQEQIARWIADGPDEIVSRTDALTAETAEKISAWNEIGRLLCEAFLTTAEDTAACAA